MNERRHGFASAEALAQRAVRRIRKAKEALQRASTDDAVKFAITAGDDLERASCFVEAVVASLAGAVLRDERKGNRA